MKKKMMLALAVVSSLLVSTPSHAAWIASGLVVNPVLGQVLLEQVATIDITPHFCAFGAASVVAQLRIQHRDATNTTTIKEQILPVGPSGSVEFCLPQGDTLILAGERVRIVTLAAVVGTASVSFVTDIQ